VARLDIRLITDVAVELLDEVGLAELSTRRLAARLGVQSPTLYWHVKNKAQLLDLVAERICEVTFDIDPYQTWRDQLISGLRQFRALLLSHRDLAALLRERPPTGPNRLAHLEATVRILFEAGFSEEEAAGIARLLAAHVLASTQQADPEIDLPSGEYPNLERIGPVYARVSGDELFDLGVEIILDGLEQRLKQAAKRRRASRS
jgi:TetR/AcrR family tetracycline transcriptional repressor